jgi:endonuclease G
MERGRNVAAWTTVGIVALGFATSTRRAIARPDRDKDAPPLASVVSLFGHRGFSCSGVVVGPRHVLTAQHCLPAFAIGVGSDTRTARRHRVTGSTIFGKRLDLALLVVRDPVKLPAVAVGGDLGTFPKTVHIAGFGATGDQGVLDRGALHARSATINSSGCANRDAHRSGCSPGVELVVARGVARDTCNGDSGGPVLERRSDGWHVIAITSRSVQRALLPCGDGGIYVRTDVIDHELARKLRERLEEK